MQTIPLASTGRMTTKLGFGCAYLVPENAGLLDVAYDAGIRHFDVAPSYARGSAELGLGKFLKRHGSDVTVTTKYGIVPPVSGRLYTAARRIARPLVQNLRRAPSVSSAISQSVSALYRKASFTAAEARASLERSLKALGRDRVDLLLMHEAAASDLADPGLRDFLEERVRSGRIGGFGVGGKSDRIESLSIERPAYSRILQFEWSPLDGEADWQDRFCVVYHVLGSADVRRGLRSPARCRSLSEAIGCDLAEPGMVERLVFKAALELRPTGMVLFSSTKPANILANVRTAEDASLRRPALRLVEILTEDARGAAVSGRSA